MAAVARAGSGARCRRRREEVDVGEIVTFLLGQCVCVLQGDEAAPVRVCCFEFGDIGAQIAKSEGALR